MSRASWPARLTTGVRPHLRAALDRDRERRRERQHVDDDHDVAALGEGAGAHRSPLERDRHVAERSRPGLRRAPLITPRRPRRAPATGARARRAPRAATAQAGVELEHPLVVGRRGRHVVVQPGLPVAQLLHLPVQPCQLLARRPRRGRIGRHRPPRPPTPTHRPPRGRRPRRARRSRRRPAQREVLVHPARQVPQPAVAEQRDRRSHTRSRKYRSCETTTSVPGPAVEQVLERGQRVDVEVVRRLVEQQHVGLVHQQPQQLQPPPLAAGQLADRRPLRVADEAEPLAQLGRGDRPALAEVDLAPHLLDGLQHPQRRVELGDVLREVGQAAP